MTHAISVSESVQLSYYDSGAPTGFHPYTTIFAVHGLGSSAFIFSRVLAHAKQANEVRVVAINRRNYGASTPFSVSEQEVIENGSDDQRTEFMKLRGVELATFVHKFIESERLAAYSLDLKAGGVALLGWSFGNPHLFQTIAYLESLPQPVQETFRTYVHTLIVHEPGSFHIGLAPDPQLWLPWTDTNIPEASRVPFTSSWITSYFDHKNVTSRNSEDLEWASPSTNRPPTIYSISASDRIQIDISKDAETIDTGIAFNFIPQHVQAYHKALFDQDVRNSVPHMKVHVFAGTATSAISLTAAWAVEAEDKALGGGFVETTLVDGGNHFIHWDDPEKSHNLYLQLIGQR